VGKRVHRLETARFFVTEGNPRKGGETPCGEKKSFVTIQSDPRSRRGVGNVGTKSEKRKKPGWGCTVLEDSKTDQQASRGKTGWEGVKTRNVTENATKRKGKNLSKGRKKYITYVEEGSSCLGQRGDREKGFSPRCHHVLGLSQETKSQ